MLVQSNKLAGITRLANRCSSVGAHHTRPRYQLAKLYPVWASSIFHLGQLPIVFQEIRRFALRTAIVPSLRSLRSFAIFAPNFSPQFSEISV